MPVLHEHQADCCGHEHENAGTAVIVERSPSVQPEQTTRKLSPFGRLFRFFGWWLGITGLYSTFSVCPFCGRQGCPAGLVSAGTVGAFLALCAQDWKLLAGYLRRRLRRQHLKDQA